MTKYKFAENALQQLTKNGATVELKGYDGGHGWQGDVFGNIRAGIEFLRSRERRENGPGTGRLILAIDVTCNREPARPRADSPR